ncbi:MAG: prepilin-type N-terminal cleavage/methylation domain-containing protein [bacterium]
MGRHHAFTLIELLIVVAILGILATLAIPNLLNAQIRAKTARAKSDMKVMETALHTYRMDHSAYFQWGGSETSGERYHALTTPVAYLTLIPIDPFVYNPLALPDTLDVFESTKEIDYIPYNEQGFLFLSSNRPDHRITDWMLGSLGPDICQQAAPELRKAGPNLGLAYTSLLYMPSNGLRSFGDLLHVSWSPIRF